MQFVFQDADASLNPSLTVAELVGRPLRLYHRLTGAALREQVVDLLAAVRLGPRYLHRLPVTLSGGEKQRVAIARAFAAHPRILICDEPTSALDISVQAVVLEELRALQARHGTAIVFISHDLGVVRQIADTVAILYKGQIIEAGPVAAVLDTPSHVYTRELLHIAQTGSINR